jgi:Ser/Thr protein kinase RdoA (MazF antagonist)
VNAFPSQTSDAAHPFDQLTPQAVLDMLDLAGWRGDGRLLQLNSYENRVFQVVLEDEQVVVAKFYRPGRWTDAQILEEHGFAAELAAAEVPVVAPLAMADGQTLAHGQAARGQAFRIAVYPRRSGHGPELDDADTLRWLGRFIARLHLVGEQAAFAHRRTLDATTFGASAVQRVRALAALPPAQAPAWLDAAQCALAAATAMLQATPAVTLRIHGDCHPGNILWRQPEPARTTAGPQIVDLDDAVNGPAVQDLWMMLSGDREAMCGQLAALLQGYRSMRRFDTRELALIEPLRTLRMLHHSAWIAERWHDPAFPVAFPWFGTPGYWDQQAAELRGQVEAMAEPPLSLDWLA